MHWNWTWAHGQSKKSVHEDLDNPCLAPLQSRAGYQQLQHSTRAILSLNQVSQWMLLQHHTKQLTLDTSGLPLYLILKVPSVCHAVETLRSDPGTTSEVRQKFPNMASKSLVILDLDKQVHRILRWMMNIVTKNKPWSRGQTVMISWVCNTTWCVWVLKYYINCNSLPSLVLGITIMHLSKAKVR